ncbi:MAG: beta-lactamase family protein [Candidatus Thiodiazotropha lotti]|uniref:Beta-lactamase family protein n=1 Tax=Candidatus Thiodiazotropha lotti TaxID=2792787 RepID=A0A9E4K502_9GAMM|nr:beta-lactamase family protein [Candidatus Thiodiazotropha lotti]MCW4203607.1 beta-lactamase family protein [Candidatus Thiodiazotropha lotti]
MKSLKQYWPVILTSALFGMSLLTGCNSNNSDDATANEQFQDALEEAVSKGLPAVSVRIAGRNIDFSGSAGMSDLETMEEATAEHRFYVASVGKTFVAATLVQMASEGLVGLDDRITDWLPDEITNRIPSSDQMTIRMLLNHTTGLFDFQNDSEAWDNDFFYLSGPTRHWQQADALPFFLDQPLHFEPGSNYSYSNSNYILAALIIESASGTTLQSEIRNRIIEPLGLEHTLQGHEAEGIPGLVHGYVDDEGESIDVYPWYSHFGLADGGIQTTADDLAKFILGILRTDLVLDDAMRTEMLQPSMLGTPASNYGLGIKITPIAGSDEVIYSHSGKDPGYQAEMIYFQEKDTVITLCANGSFDPYDSVAQELLLKIYQLLEELQD